MNNKNLEWRINQIASTILYRCFGDVSIEVLSNTKVIDWLVTYNDGTDLKFGVIIKKVGAKNAPVLPELADEVNEIDFSNSKYRHPIIALFVEESTENAKVAFLVGWRFGSPRIYKNFELRNLTPQTGTQYLQVIKSMDEVIRVLSTDELKVLKRITFSRKLHDNREQKAEILYLRRLSSSYRTNQKEVVDDKERFERLLKGTPEEEYPRDELDRLIIEAVKCQFKNAKVHSKLVLFSTDLDDLQMYKNVHCVKTNIMVSPDLTKVSAVEMAMLNGLEMFNVNVDVFVENIFYQTAFDGISFDKEEPLEGWLLKLAEWKKMRDTLSPISEFFR